MSKAFVDATVLCDAIPLPSVDPRKTAAAAAALGKYSETEAPYYALRELRAGPLGSMMAFHNLLVIRTTLDEAIFDFQRMSSFTPRKWAVSSSHLTRALAAMLAQAKAAPAQAPGLPDIKTQLEDYLALQIMEAWQRRKAVLSRISQPLACFVDGELALVGRTLVIRPGELEGCAKEARCSAAAALHQRPAEVQALVDALHPGKDTAGEKRETTGRRKALKEILTKAPAAFDKRKCRHIGDAYYCVMSPQGFDILTTNVEDFTPLAAALKKSLAHP